MICERVQLELEDFLYGELAARREDEVRAHLAACAKCQEARMRLDSEDAAFAGFRERAAIEPSGEMWRTIRDQIRKESAPVRPTAPPPWWKRIWAGGPGVVSRQGAFAASLIILSILGLGTLYVLKRGNGGSPEFAKGAPVQKPMMVDVGRSLAPSNGPVLPAIAVREPARRVGRVSDEKLLLRQIARAESEYRGAVRLLNRAIARRRDSLDPVVARQYKSSLALIDGSIEKSRSALWGSPNDLSAGQFLLAAYARKVELMQDVALR